VLLPFDAFTVKFPNRVRRVTTDVHVSEAYELATPPAVLPSARTVSALWDTGATGSVIAPSVVAALGLVQKGVARVSHADGVNPNAPVYLVNITLPNRVCVEGVRVTATAITDFEAVIGMDIISTGDLSLTHADGKTWMSFRIPPYPPALDYVVEFNRAMVAGINRNAPCPCGALAEDGSRKKVKKCHGKLV
jgi:predicted aspartyl protease